MDEQRIKAQLGDLIFCVSAEAAATWPYQRNGQHMVRLLHALREHIVELLDDDASKRLAMLVDQDIAAVEAAAKAAAGQDTSVRLGSFVPVLYELLGHLEEQPITAAHVTSCLDAALASIQQSQATVMQPQFGAGDVWAGLKRAVNWSLENSASGILFKVASAALAVAIAPAPPANAPGVVLNNPSGPVFVFNYPPGSVAPSPADLVQQLQQVLAPTPPANGPPAGAAGGGAASAVAAPGAAAPIPVMHAGDPMQC